MAKEIKPTPHVPVTIETLEQTLAVLAYVVVKHGQVYAPLFERVEREVEVARNGPEARARRFLESYTGWQIGKPPRP